VKLLPRQYFRKFPQLFRLLLKFKLGSVNLSGFQNLSKKLDDLLSQDPATKISLCSNRNRVLVRSKMAVIAAVFPLDPSPTSEPLSLKSEPIILLASSWDNKHRLFAQGLKLARPWSTLLFAAAQFGVFKLSHNYEPQKNSPNLSACSLGCVSRR
jgi:hypothetical protein